MAVLNRDEFMNRLHERVGEDTSEAAIAFIEDMTDTYADLEKRATGDGTDWERKYRELDESWKARYKHRFFSGGEMRVESSETSVVDEPREETITVEELFEERSEK